MKKFIVLLGVLFSIYSCQTIRSTAVHKAVDIQPISALIADVEVGPERISYTMIPHRRVQRGGMENVKSTAIREALQKNGGGDLLVGLEVQTKTARFLCWRRIISITVSGYPARYTNFESPDKSYWTPLGVWMTQDAIQKSKYDNRGTGRLKDIINITKEYK